MRLFGFLKPVSSAPVARERLQILLEYERRMVSQSSLITTLKEEILAVVARHVDIDPEKFWAIPHNQMFAAGKAGIGKRTIDWKGFDKRYCTALVNDIAAARAYLIVIGRNPDAVAEALHAASR